MKKIACLLILLAFLQRTFAQSFVSATSAPGSFVLSDGSGTSTILVDKNDDWLVNKAAQLLQTDIEKVTGKKPVIVDNLSSSKNVVIVGSLHSVFIQKLIAAKELDVKNLQGKWEAFRLQTIDKPFAGIDKALVIVGSDKRGTAYGVLELSKQIGVSPWWWWADVPVKKKQSVFIKPGIYNFGSPSVKYRGIFINDEAPAFSGWTKEKFGGVNHLVYEKIFELLLRLKANYLWPAMWGNAFNDDDTLNSVLADKWGIVMGTSHHEPMLRAQQEWKRYGKGPWDYTKNDSTLRAFWKRGIQNMGKHESIVTVGMRGDGDMPMTQGTAIGLLEKIVADQRKIIEDVTHKPASQTPQMWALYKEVQDYYDKGMRVPDDVTLLLCDDNWGNLRKLPKLNEPKRSGGYGIYYHFDYVGGPRNYKWINTNNIARVWEQMHLAKEYGVNQVWIVNVGDLKPMEFPISFFLDYAWDTKKWNEDNLHNYYTQWASEQFGAAHAKEIGEILRKYSQYAARRKPELLDEKTYSLVDYDEWERVVKEWDELEQRAEGVNKQLSPEYKDAFFELVLHPVKAFDNLHKMYLDVALNHLKAEHNAASANDYANRVTQLYETDSLLSVAYNQIANGKWNHMMDQTHIGYTYWQQPPVNKMPTVVTFPESSLDHKTQRAQWMIDSISKILRNSIDKIAQRQNKKNASFTEENNVVSIKAIHFTKSINSSSIKWKAIPDIGKDGSGISTFPVTASTQLSSSRPHIEYDFYCINKGKANLNLYFSPTLNFHNDSTGLQYAVSIDDEKPQIFSLNKEEATPIWSKWVADNIIIKKSEHHLLKPGKHTIKYWMISPGIVLQKLVLDFGGLKPSYLGPPETKN
ncbi:glycosyl hydrolase 115 family protein [Flavisolibacter ginsenosidimutans]|uniref:Glycosyhydrolase n=1 Tax=Flavisolibacter ginsenosidimutans TaxID=661481 RepID=A0A5B8UI52_9BACT|nr:glycosyl hydrolase 115 family protein [Flavisolibacter ginsenosidimutans]QEC56341.1 glycosyhydrolase [Flavisolibacter ginsenosidimutans]